MYFISVLLSVRDKEFEIRIDKEFARRTSYSGQAMKDGLGVKLAFGNGETHNFGE